MVGLIDRYVYLRGVFFSIEDIFLYVFFLKKYIYFQINYFNVVLSNSNFIVDFEIVECRFRNKF